MLCFILLHAVASKPISKGYPSGYLMAILTTKKASAIKPESAALPHGGVVGLWLFPYETPGHGQWKIRYTSPTTGKRRAKSLGAFPEIGIAEAGRLGQSIRDAVDAGIDPLDVSLSPKNEPTPVIDPAAIPTVAEAALAVHQAKLPGWKNAKHAAQWISSLQTYALPMIGGLPLPAVTAQDIADVLHPIWRDKHETASRVRQRLSEIFGWAMAHRFISQNPVDVVGHLLPRQSARPEHFPAMDWRILPAWVAKYLASSPPTECTRPALLFLILTGSRSGEVRGAQSQEIDWRRGVWHLSAERMKAQRAHQVPLSTQALALLRGRLGLHESLLFPSPRGIIPCDMVLTSFLRRIRAPSTTAGRVATAHGFRSTLRDWCSVHGVRHDIAERLLAHEIGSAVEVAYHREPLLDERREVLQNWADYVLSEVK